MIFPLLHKPSLFNYYQFAFSFTFDTYLYFHFNIILHKIYTLLSRLKMIDLNVTMLKYQ